MNRGSRQPQPAHQQPTHDGSAPLHGGHTPHSPQYGGGAKSFLSMKFVSVLLLFSATILVVALVWSLVIGGPKPERSFVDTGRLQAVFLNGGQVYFGRIKDLNDKYMRIEDIYYLRVNQQVQPDQNGQAAQQDISLVKLGCELHGPEDEMLINREQIVFWENLKDDGQVADAVKRYKEENPGGQDCEQPQTTPGAEGAGAGAGAGIETENTEVPGNLNPGAGTNQ